MFAHLHTRQRHAGQGHAGFAQQRHRRQHDMARRVAPADAEQRGIGQPGQNRPSASAKTGGTSISTTSQFSRNCVMRPSKAGERNSENAALAWVPAGNTISGLNGSGTSTS